MPGTSHPLSTAPASRVLESFVVPEGGLRLERGGHVPDVRIAYRLAGPAGAPVVGVLGGISADRVVCADDGGRGWWEWMVGVERPLDLRTHQVLSLDYLGGRGDTTGMPEEGEGPLLTPRDQADVLAAVTSALRVEPLCGLIGASFGGAVALAFAARHPEKVRKTLVIGAAHRSHPLATALRVIQRRIVRDAVAQGREEEGLALARALAMTTYRSDVEFEERFAGPPVVDGTELRFPVEDYIDHHGRTFAGRFTADQFRRLSQSSDLHHVDPREVRSPVTLVSTDPDMLAPPWQMEALARELGEGHELVRVSSKHGHDAFLTDEKAFSRIVSDFIGVCDAFVAGGPRALRGQG